MNDFPKVLTLKRGGKARRCVMSQPYAARGACLDILRIAFVLIA